MKISSGLPNRPAKPSAKAKPWPMKAAISVARTKPRRVASSARSTRPPSIGNAGIMLNSARKRFTAASRSTSETAELSTAPVAHAELRAGKQHEPERDHDIDQRSGDCDEEFLVRRFRDALEPRQSADRQQR